MDQQITYDDVSRHIGALYLTYQQDMSRSKARIKQLEAELLGERQKRVTMEREAAKAVQPS